MSIVLYTAGIAIAGVVLVALGVIAIERSAERNEGPGA
jgi:hypothetical protein